jgi:hypothetical protein
MPPPAPQFPLPPAVHLTNVAPGGSAAAEAGAVLHVSGTATASLTGDDAGLFRIAGMETLRIVKDPDAPHADWETVSEVNGAGPVDGGPGFGVTVSFTCPDPPAKEEFTATAVLTVNTQNGPVTHDFPVTATVIPENLTVRLNASSFFLGETKDLTVTLRSTYQRDISGLLSFSIDHLGVFSFGNAINAVTVPRLGSTVVTVPAKCAPTAATGDYAMTALFEPDDTAASAKDTEDVRVLQHRTANVITSFPPQLSLFHPSTTPGSLVVSVNSGDPATIFFETIGIPDTVSVTMPESVTVRESASVPVTINVDSSLNGFTDAFAPITIAWQIPADDFHPEEVKGSLVLSEVSLPMRVLTVPSGPLDVDTISGFATLTIRQDGSVNFQGHAHDSGFFGGDYLVAVWFPSVEDDQGRTVTFTRHNNIAGTIGGGDSRDDDWDLNGPTDPAMKQFIADRFDDFVSDSPGWNILFDSDASTDIVALLGLLLEGFAITAIVIVLLD